MRGIFCVLSLALFFAPLLFSFTRAQEDDNVDGANSGRQEELRQELRELQAEIQGLSGEISQKRNEEKSLNREISILNNQVRKTELELQQTALALRSTDLTIQANGVKIEKLSERIEREKQIIAELLRAMYREDARGDVVEVVMSSGSLSDFFEQQKFLESIQASVHQALQNLKTAKGNVEQEQEALEEERENQYRLRVLQDAQRSGLEASKKEKDHLLNFTQAQKEEFERLVFQKTKTAEEIRNQLFRLEGADVALSFSEAYTHALFASQLTGVRPAFLLAVLKRESSWGANTGLCILVDPETGTGRGVNTGSLYERVMKPSRDIPPFLQITEQLGRDPYNTRVSCPHPDYGYGGAMGPAQFIPSTWMGYKDEVSALLGHVADPWNIGDAFVASAVKLARGGATSQTYGAERKAALVYYAGGGWSNPAFWPYTDSVPPNSPGVMFLASQYQGDIDILEGR